MIRSVRVLKSAPTRERTIPRYWVEGRVLSISRSETPITATTSRGVPYTTGYNVIREYSLEGPYGDPGWIRTFNDELFAAEGAWLSYLMGCNKPRDVLIGVKNQQNAETFTNQEAIDGYFPLSSRLLPATLVVSLLALYLYLTFVLRLASLITIALMVAASVIEMYALARASRPYFRESNRIQQELKDKTLFDER